jgi:UDP-N-acetylmuramate-alanine ligase
LLIKILHTSCKVAATTQAVKEQYPNRTLVACLELHTYSLNAEFLKEYEGALAFADEAVVLLTRCSQNKATRRSSMIK